MGVELRTFTPRALTSGFTVKRSHGLGPRLLKLAIVWLPTSSAPTEKLFVADEIRSAGTRGPVAPSLVGASARWQNRCEICLILAPTPGRAYHSRRKNDAEVVCDDGAVGNAYESVGALQVQIDLSRGVGFKANAPAGDRDAVWCPRSHLEQKQSIHCAIRDGFRVKGKLPVFNQGERDLPGSIVNPEYFVSSIHRNVA